MRLLIIEDEAALLQSIGFIYKTKISYVNGQPILTRQSKSGNSTGLGLSIVKQICDISNFTIQYQFTNRWDQFLF